jgi:hypothetical protein
MITASLSTFVGLTSANAKYVPAMFKDVHMLIHSVFTISAMGLFPSL